MKAVLARLWQSIPAWAFMLASAAVALLFEFLFRYGPLRHEARFWRAWAVASALSVVNALLLMEAFTRTSASLVTLVVVFSLITWLGRLSIQAIMHRLSVSHVLAAALVVLAAVLAWRGERG